MAHETVHLAEYASGLRYNELPPEVVQRAKDCIADTVAVIVQGADCPGATLSSAMRNGPGREDGAASSASMGLPFKLLRPRLPMVRWPMLSSRTT